MSAEDVEMVLSFQLGPDGDVAALANDEDASGRYRDAVAHRFDAAAQFTMRFPGLAPVVYSGLDGFRDCWRDWLKHWGATA